MINLRNTKKQSAFTLIELLVVISVIALLASIALIWMSGVRAQSRDTERVATTDALRKALEMYYDDKGYYPTATNWVKIEEDAGIADALKPYLTRIPSDPSYPKVDGEKVYSYQYQSTLDNQGYKIHVEMETSKFTTYQYEVSSGGGSSIVYGGGGSGPSNAPTFLYVGYPLAQGGSENPTSFIYSTPFFSAVNNHDADATTVQIQLTDASYATPIWNSGDITVASFATGTRSQDIFYGTYGSGGSPPTGILEVGKTYYWRVRTKTISGYSNWSADGTIDMSSAALTARFYTGTGDGYVYKGDVTWAGAHDATVGESTDYWSIPLDEIAVASVKLGVAPNIFRGYFPFDTAFLPDTAAIVSASLNSKLTYTDDTDNDGKDFLVVTQGLQASPNTLTVNDYDDNGSDNGSAGRAMFTPVQEGSDRKDVTDLFVYNYNTWNINATGTGWISKNGWTKLGLREGHDVLNTAVANGIEVDMKNSKASFGDSPYFEVTYASSTGGGGGSASTTKTLFFRSDASAVVSFNAAVDQLSESAGASPFGTDGGSIKKSKNLGTWQFIPGTFSNTANYAIPSTPNSKGWIWDNATPGNFSNGLWTINIDIQDNTTNMGTAVIKAQVWKVMANSTAVTQVTNLSGILSSAPFIPMNTKTRKTLTFSPGAFTLNANEYIYAEVYLEMTVAGGNNSVMKILVDDADPATQGSIITSNFTPTLVDKYDGSLDAFHQFNGSNFTARGQSFTANIGGKLNNVKFYLTKFGLPTGNAHAYIYAETHSTAYGTDSIPTGSPLATSDALNVSTLPTSPATLKTFTFSGINQIDLVAGSKYVVVFEYIGGDSSNYVNLYYDNTAPTGGGNMSYWSGLIWGAVSNPPFIDMDYNFFVNI